MARRSKGMDGCKRRKVERLRAPEELVKNSDELLEEEKNAESGDSERRSG